MGQRELRRVPVEFDWPLNKVWTAPENLHEKDCEVCAGSGYSAHARHLRDRWYGYVPFDPSETGSVPLTAETPEVRAFAERNVEHGPEFYGRGEGAIVREAQRLADLWNASWSHHLDQADVDVLVAEGRLHDLTRQSPDVTAEQVNRWSLGGFRHDAINCWVVVSAKCERDGQPETCAACDGHGSIERYPGQRAEAEAWEPTDPPSGDGWQLWQTTSEGSPVSPVFATAEELAAWCAPNATTFGRERMSYERWLETFQNDDVWIASTMMFVRPS